MIIDHACAMMLCRLFDRMYKLGVNDAANEEDEGLCLLWIEKTSFPGTFGRLGDETSHDPMYWQITVQKEAFLAGIGKKFTDFVRNAGRYTSNYFSVAWVVMQCFYNQGLKDWAENPGACTLQSFNSVPRQKWQEKKHIWQLPAIVGLAQEFAFQRNHSDSQNKGKLALKPYHYTTFIKAFGIAALYGRKK